MHICELIWEITRVMLKHICSCYTTILYRMYTKLGVQEWQSFMYLDIKFGGHPIQNDYKATMYTQPFVEVL